MCPQIFDLYYRDETWGVARDYTTWHFSRFSTLWTGKDYKFAMGLPTRMGIYVRLQHRCGQAE